MKLEANNEDIFIPLHVTKSLFVLPNPNFSLSDSRKSLQEDNKKYVEKSPAQTLHLLLPQIAKWENGMHSPAHKQPLKSLPLKQICQQMFNRKWSELLSPHTHDFLGMGGKEALGTFFMICR